MALSLSFCGVGTVRNLGASSISFSTKTSLTCKKSNQGFKTGATATDVVATEPITKEDLISYFAAGCKPKEMWRIGTEYETFGFDVKTLCPMNFEQVTALLSGVSERFYWDKVMENGRIIGLKQGMKNISLEAGGQVELSGAPLKTLHETSDELRSHLHQVKTIGQEMGIKFIGIGYEPKSSLGITVPKLRCKILNDYLANFGSSGEDMLSRTCTVQVNLDYSSETDMIRKFRASLALQPIAAALFANSPFSNGKPSGFLSKRSNVWLTVAKNRTGMIPFVFENSFGFERYAEYALDVPMMFLYRNKRYLDCRGITFRDFFFGKKSHLSDEQPTISDWENHLGTIWPEVRLKRYLEMRGADTGSRTMMNALPALWVGLLYDEESLQSVLDMIDDWTTEEREMLRTQVPITGLKTMFRNGPLKNVAEDIIKIAKGGLERRRYQEAGFLNAVAEVARTGVTPAEELFKLYNGAWGQCIDRVYEELLY